MAIYVGDIPSGPGIYVGDYSGFNGGGIPVVVDSWVNQNQSNLTYAISPIDSGENSDWAVGFRPGKVRLTISALSGGDVTSIEVQVNSATTDSLLFGQSGVAISSDSDAVVVGDLDFSLDEDIGEILISAEDGSSSYVTLTNIEFSEAT